MSKKNNVVEVYCNQPDFMIHVNFVSDSENFIFVDSANEEENALRVPISGLEDLKNAIESAIEYRNRLADQE